MKTTTVGPGTDASLDAVLHAAGLSRKHIPTQEAVRKGSWLFGYKYLDLAAALRRTYWWGRNDISFGDCLTHDLVRARSALSFISDKGTPIQEEK